MENQSSDWSDAQVCTLLLNSISLKRGVCQVLNNLTFNLIVNTLNNLALNYFMFQYDLGILTYTTYFCSLSMYVC